MRFDNIALDLVLEVFHGLSSLLALVGHLASSDMDAVSTLECHVQEGYCASFGGTLSRLVWAFLRSRLAFSHIIFHSYYNYY